MSQGNKMRTMLIIIGGVCLVAIIAALCVSMTKSSRQPYDNTNDNANMQNTGTEDKEMTDNLKLVTENANEGIANLPLGIYLTVTDYRDGIATVQVDNQSGYELTYTTEYTLFKESDGEWAEVPMKSGAALPEAVQNPIRDLEKVTVEVDLTVYEKLEAGNYRLVMGDNTADFMLQ